MEKDFSKGFNMALDFVESAIQYTIKKKDDNLDAVISALYIARLTKDEFYEESIMKDIENSLFDDETCFGGCVVKMSEESIDELNKILKEMLEDE